MLTLGSASFEDLAKKISPILKRITYKLNGHLSFFNDQDLYQEALIHLWEDFKLGKLSNKTDSYILQGCYFYLKNYIRKNTDRAKLITLDSFVGRDNDTAESAFEALFLQDKDSENYRGRLDNKLLFETICNNGFTPREKEIIFLYADGLTVREIGARLGISHVRVVKLMSRIKGKCKKYVDL